MPELPQVMRLLKELFFLESSTAAAPPEPEIALPRNKYIK